MEIYNLPKPVLLIGLPSDFEISEQEHKEQTLRCDELQVKYSEKMPDYHVIVYYCMKVEQITFNILTPDGKQSNI